jgi:bifunctional non-homologous end joining protein LigD
VCTSTSNDASGPDLPTRSHRVAAMAAPAEVWDIGGREVRITNPDAVRFPATGHTKRDLVRYYLAIADGALRGAGGRPQILKRYVKGVGRPPFFQKRAPTSRPGWVTTVTLAYPSGRTADEVVVDHPAQLAWIVNLGCIDLNPHAVRADDLDHPDELRVDLDPVPGVGWSQITEVAMVVRAVLDDAGLVGWPKTSGSRGFHVNCRIARRWTFPQVRRAAEALAREVARRAPESATARWWKEERHGVFVDYNQNARDRTVASAYSVRPVPDARVSTPLHWDEVADCDPAAFTIDSVPVRVAALGDLTAGLDDAVGSLDALLALADEQDAANADADPDGRVAPAPPGHDSGASGRRRTSVPLIEIARAATTDEAMEGLARWRQRHPDVWAMLESADVLVDAMRGRSSTWTRIRLNLRRVPADRRPSQGPLEVDYDPWDDVRGDRT